MKQKLNRFQIVREKKKIETQEETPKETCKIYLKDEIRRIRYSFNNDGLGNWTPLDIYDEIIVIRK